MYSSVTDIIELLGFSALQRAENSSIVLTLAVQCAAYRFSALQRAENSSIIYEHPQRRRPR